MKKTFAILLSLVLSVVVLFAFAIGASADSVKGVTSVTVVDAEDNKIVLDETNTTYSAQTGTIVFDASCGALTLEGVSGVKSIQGRDGALTVTVKGVNTVESDGANLISLEGGNADVPTNLTVKGDGILNVKGQNYLLMSRSGRVEITDKVTLNLEVSNNGISDAIHVASGGSDLVFSGNAKVNATAHGTTCFRNASDGAIVIRDNAEVSALLTGTELVSRTAINGRKFKMFDGVLTVTLDAEGIPSNINIKSVYTCTAVSVSAKGDVSATANFLGGEVKADLVGTVNQKAAFSVLSVDGADAVTLKNTKFDINIDYPGTNDGATGVFNLAGASSLTVTSCMVDVSALKNIALFSVSNVGDTKENAVFKMDFNNTILKGACARLLFCPAMNEAKPPFVSAINLDFDKSNTADLALASGVLHANVKNIINVTTNTTYLTGADFTSGVALITGDPETKVTTVGLTPTKGWNIYLSAGKRTLSETDAKYLGISVDSIVYDPITATVTLNDMNGGVNRLWAYGDITYVLKGDNAVTMKTELGQYYAFGGSGDVKIIGDGTLTVSGGTNTIVGNELFVIEGNAKVKAISHKNADGDCAVHMTGDGNNSFIVRGNATLDLLIGESGFFLAGGQPYLQITEKAKVTIAPIEDSFAGQAIYMCPDMDNGTGSQDAILEVSGSASLKIDKGASTGVEFGFVSSEKVTDKEGNVTETPAIKDATAVNAVFEIYDDAVVDIGASGRAVFFNVKGKADTALLRINDNAKVSFASVDSTNESTTGAALEMYSSNSIITMETTKPVSMTSNVGGDRGALYVRGTDYMISVKDTVWNVTNKSESKVAPGGELAYAMNLDGKGDGQLTVAGKSVVTVSAEKNGEDRDNRAIGIFLNSNHTMTIQDNALVNVYSDGDSEASLGAGLHLKKATVLVKDNGKLNARASGTSVAAMMFEGASTLIVEDYGRAYLIGDGEGVSGARSYNRTAKGEIVVTDGSATVEVSGDPAFNTKLKKVTVTTSLIKAGENKKSAAAVNEISGSEKYVFLSANAKIQQMAALGSSADEGGIYEAQGMVGGVDNALSTDSQAPVVTSILLSVLAVLGVAVLAVVAIVVYKKKYNR